MDERVTADTTRNDSALDRPALSLDNLQRYYVMEIRAAEERAIEAEKRAARERGRAEALRAALEWVQAKLRPQEAPDGTHPA